MIGTILLILIAFFFALIASHFFGRLKPILLPIFTLLLAYASLYEVSKGGNLIFSLVKYTAILIVAGIIFSLGRRVSVNVGDLQRRLENVEGKLNAILNLLKKQGIVKRFDEKEVLLSFGSSYEKIKSSEHFDYYRVYGDRTYIVKIDRETGLLAGFEVESPFNFLSVLKIIIPVVLIAIVLIPAYKAYKLGISPDDYIKLETVLKSVSEIKKGVLKKECTMEEVTIALKNGNIINQTESYIIVEYKGNIYNITYEIMNKTIRVCGYKGETPCGCINVSQEFITSLVGGG